LFGCPPHKIGDLEHATFSNIEESNREFYQGTLRRWCERIESEVNRKLFSRSERLRFYAQYNMNGFLRGNSQAQADVLTKVFSMAGLSVNGVCQELGYNSIGPAGDVRFVSTNLIRLDALSTVMTPTNPTAVPTDVPDPQAEPVR
jgi:phage portal protein BeeE